MNENSIKVSIVIPAYNAAKYICQSLDSVLSQTYRDFEIIVVDDGSIDNTKEVLKPYFGQIRYIYKPNGGPASARNTGINNAKGEYIAFLDADDLWLPEKLELQIELLEKDHEIGLVHSDSIPFDENGVICNGNRKRDGNSLSGYVFPALFMQNFVQTLTVVAKAHCFKTEGLFDESKQLFAVEDYDMWLRISRNYKFGYINKPLAKHRIHQNQISKNIDRSYLNEKSVLEKLIGNMPDLEAKVPISAKHRLAKLFYEYGYDHFSEGNLKAARDKFKKAFEYKSGDFKSYKYYLLTFFDPWLIDYFRGLKRK